MRCTLLARLVLGFTALWGSVTATPIGAGSSENSESSLTSSRSDPGQEDFFRELAASKCTLNGDSSHKEKCIKTLLPILKELHEWGAPLKEDILGEIDEAEKLLNSTSTKRSPIHLCGRDGSDCNSALAAHHPTTDETTKSTASKHSSAAAADPCQSIALSKCHDNYFPTLNESAIPWSHMSCTQKFWKCQGCRLRPFKHCSIPGYPNRTTTDTARSGPVEGMARLRD